MRCYLLWLIVIGVMAVDCEYYTQLAQKYQCYQTSFLQAFLLQQCQKLSASTTPKLQSLAECVQQNIQQTVQTVTVRYNLTLDCIDDAPATSAYLQCFSADPLRSYCEATQQEWYQLLAISYNSTNIGTWERITTSFMGIDSNVIKLMAQQEAVDPGSLPTFIDNWIANVSTPAEQLCSRQATLTLLHNLQGKYQSLVQPMPRQSQQAEETSIPSFKLSEKEPNDCQNFTNVTIENRRNEQIYMVSCQSILFQNVTIRNNVNLRIRIASAGALVLQDVRMNNNSGLEWRLTSIGRANFSYLSVSNCNQDSQDPQSPSRRTLFTLNSMSLQMDSMQVKNYSGSSLISMYDGTLFLTNCWFEDVVIDPVYSWGGVIDLRRGTIMLVQSTFRNVAANTGGGLSLRDGSANVASCRFDRMQVQKGGAIYLSVGSLAVSDSEFRNSRAQTAAAIYSSFSSVMISRSTVSNCTSNGGSMVFVNSTVNVTQSEIDNNNAVRAAGMYSYAGSLSVDNGNVFSGNTAEQTSALAGFLGKVSLTNNNTFKNNHQTTGNSPIGVHFGTTAIDDTNQISDDSQQPCTPNCGVCILDPSTFAPVCSMCLLSYSLTAQGTCKWDQGGNPAWLIVLLVSIFIVLGVGGFFLYRKLRRNRAMASYNQL